MDIDCRKVLEGVWRLGCHRGALGDTAALRAAGDTGVHWGTLRDLGVLWGALGDTRKVLWGAIGDTQEHYECTWRHRGPLGHT